MGVLGCLFNLLKVVFFGVIVICAIHYWITTKQYLVDEEEFNALGRSYVDKSEDIETTMNLLTQELRRRYPGHILEDERLQWIFINCGGWMGSVKVLHASFTEYILFFGTAVYSTGHSGRYWANVTDTFLSGAITQWREGTLKNETFIKGQTLKHAWGETTSVTFHAGTWAIEYGRGFIPSTLGFALGDSIFSTQDFVSIFYLFRAYTYAMIQEYGLYLKEFL